MILICPKQDHFLYRITIVELIKVAETGLFDVELIMWSRRGRSDIPLILQNKDKLTAHGWAATFISCIYSNASARFSCIITGDDGVVCWDIQTDRQTDILSDPLLPSSDVSCHQMTLFLYRTRNNVHRFVGLSVNIRALWTFANYSIEINRLE